MTTRTAGAPRHPGRRALLAIPAVAVPAALIAAAVLIPNAASGAVDLPDKTVEQLLTFASASDVDQLSGTIEQTSNLGIPDLSALTGSLSGNDTNTSEGADVDDLLDLATGSYTAKVYLDGERGRLQVLDTLAERNVYVDGDAGVAWFVDSDSRTATKLTAPEHAPSTKKETNDLPTPEATLQEALANLDDTTEVTVGTDARVAGRDAYELILTPRTDDTLVESVNFAIDGETGLALSASVTARGETDPAFSIAFTDVSLSAPDAAALTFTPGSDTTVTEKPIELPSADMIATWRADAAAKATAGSDAATPTVYGEGWSSVVELPASADDAASPLEAITPDQQKLLDTVTTPVDGGRVFETALLTLLITDDGRVLAGAVPAARLVEAAASGQ